MRCPSQWNLCHSCKRDCYTLEQRIPDAARTDNLVAAQVNLLVARVQDAVTIKQA